jgi:peptidoglycan/xylan/chitin deacetylase (PgdA/CDA1 family)
VLPSVSLLTMLQMRPLLRRLRIRLERLLSWGLECALIRRARRAGAPFALLTFDDGPDPSRTPELLAVLGDLDVRATFFVIGVNAEAHPGIVRALLEAGMEIGSHGMRHTVLAGRSFADQTQEIERGIEAVARAAGRPVAVFRPPFGSFDRTTLEALGQLGQKMVLWNVDPKDWSGIGVERTVRRVLAAPRSPAIIVMHDHAAPTIRAVPRIVAAYRRAGYRFITVSELRDAAGQAYVFPASRTSGNALGSVESSALAI